MDKECKIGGGQVAPTPGGYILVIHHKNNVATVIGVAEEEAISNIPVGTVKKQTRPVCTCRVFPGR